MKKNLTKKLMLSVLTLAFAVVSLGASTFAWFTMSENAQVSKFQGTVKGAEGVEIAVSATTVTDSETLKWYSGVLPTTAISDVIGKVTFEAVTSQDGRGFQTLNHADGSLKGTTDGYISFRLWFKAGSDDTLNLTTLNIASSNQKTYTIDQNFRLAANQTDDDKTTEDVNEEVAANAGVNEKWTFNVGSAARVSLVPATGTTRIYELSAANVSGKDAGNSLGFNTTNGAFAYYNLKVLDAKQKLDASLADEPTKVYQNGELKETETESHEIISLKTDEPTYVDVYVWIEGWDGECLNAIFDQVLTVDFEFFLKSSFKEETN